MREKYYLAYGSNLSVEQMLFRCPKAVYVGTATIANYQLLFKGSQTGSYLTIDPKKGATVPVLVWRINEQDEKSLDRYEGYPAFYGKVHMEVMVHSLLDGRPMGVVDGLIYIMDDHRGKGCPSKRYYGVCLEGYQRFGFDSKNLERALEESVGKRQTRAILNGGWV